MVDKKKKNESSWWDKAKSYVNPYNWGVERVEAKSFSEAYQKAKKAGKKEFIYNNKRYNTQYAGSIREEKAQYGTPKEKKAIVQKKEKPINIFVYHFGANNDMGFTSHVAMEYDDKYIDYSSKGNSDRMLNCKDTDVKCYQIYPSEVGIDPQKLVAAIEKKQKSAKGKDYNLFKNNCCDQVLDVLKASGKNAKPAADSFMGKIKSEGTMIAIPQKFEQLLKSYGHEVRPEHANSGIANQVVNDDYRRLAACLSILHDPEKYRQGITDRFESKCKYLSKLSVFNMMKESGKETSRYLDELKLSYAGEDKVIAEIKRVLNKHKNDTNAQRLVTALQNAHPEVKSLLVKNGVDKLVLDSRYAQANPSKFNLWNKPEDKTNETTMKDRIEEYCNQDPEFAAKYQKLMQSR